MPEYARLSMDILAILVMTFALYFPRHRRRDMVVAYLVVNVGILAITTTLTSADGTVSAGLGFGLFGVLSIIRLRSVVLDQEEIAYYFAALALGLLAGFEVEPAWVSPVLIIAILGVLLVGDSNMLFGRYRCEEINLDAVYTDDAQLRKRLEQLLDAKVFRMIVRHRDLVNDTTLVEARYKISAQTLRRDPSD